MAVTTFKYQKGINQIKRMVELVRKMPSPFRAEFASEITSEVNPKTNKSEKELLLEKRDIRILEDSASVREITLISSTIALGAKLAKIDGAINNHERDSFKKVFPKTDHPKIELGKFFGNAANDDVSFEHYVKRVTSYFPNQEKLYKELLISLFEFGAVDGPLNVE